MTMKQILIGAMFVTVPALGTDAASEDAIKGVFTRLETCVEQHDPKCVIELFADDATYMGRPGDGRLLKGKPAILKVQEEMMKIVQAAASNPDKKGPKRKYTVQNVRWIDKEHAIADSSVAPEGAKIPDGTASAGASQAWHVTAVMTSKDGKWLFQDVRAFVVAQDPVPSTDQAPAPKVENSAPAPAAPAAAPAAPAAPAQ